jgi:hypothetical protein
MLMITCALCGRQSPRSTVCPHCGYRPAQSLPATLADTSGREQNTQAPASQQTNTLPVPLIPQQTRLWCWAASAQMIMTHLGGTTPSQCEQANHYLFKDRCCTSPTPDACVNGGWPEFAYYGYTSVRRTPPSGTGGTALTWDELRQQIDNNMPVAFSWHKKSGGGHMMTAIGYTSLNNINHVIIHDPWPVGFGDTRPIPYDVYVNGEDYDHEHWFDYYNIAQTPGGSVSTPISDADLEAARRASEAYLSTAVILSGNDVPGGIEASYVGPELPVIPLPLDMLDFPGPAGIADGLFSLEVRQVLYPVMMRDRLITATTTTKTDAHTWRPSLGNKAWIQILDSVRGRHAALTDTPLNRYYLVDISALRVAFLAFDDNGIIKFIVTLDAPELSLTTGQVLPAAEALERVRPVAREYNRNPG